MRQLTFDELFTNEEEMLNTITNGFEESINKTMEWMNTQEAREYFNKRQGMLNEFFETSGIKEEWQNIIDTRAKKGADITRQLYDYARKVQFIEHMPRYTEQERLKMNMLCDNTYELIRNVTEDEIKNIRRSLLEDYAEGRNPLQTSLKDLNLQPINGLSPQRRAEMIARTETARTSNVASIQVWKAQGVKYVALMTSGKGNVCDDCADAEGKPTPIDEAEETEVMHPNCNCIYYPIYDDQLKEAQESYEANHTGI